MINSVLSKFLRFMRETRAPAHLWNKTKIIFSGCIMLTSLACQKDTQLKNQVCFRDQCIEVELAQTPEEQAGGLQFRTSLELNSGMLFIFSESQQRSFWMKDTLIPLDMVWIDDSKKVIHVTRHAAPCKGTLCPIYSPPSSIRYVLEVNAGYVDELGIRIGDRLKF